MELFNNEEFYFEIVLSFVNGERGADPKPERSKEYITYNLSFAPGEESTLEFRRDATAAAVAATEADVLCLQEIWGQPNIDYVV